MRHPCCFRKKTNGLQFSQLLFEFEVELMMGRDARMTVHCPPVPLVHWFSVHRCQRSTVHRCHWSIVHRCTVHWSRWSTAHGSYRSAGPPSTGPTGPPVYRPRVSSVDRSTVRNCHRFTSPSLCAPIDEQG